LPYQEALPLIVTGAGVAGATGVGAATRGGGGVVVGAGSGEGSAMAGDEEGDAVTQPPTPRATTTQSSQPSRRAMP